MRTTTMMGSLVGLVLAAIAGCSGGEPEGTAGGRPEPFAPQQDTSEGLVNVGADLDAVLEKGALKDACAAWEAGQKDRRTTLLCGKAMFFYESFGTAGVPSVLVHFLLDNFPDEIGPGFEELGMVADPSSTSHLPLGLAPGAKLGGSIDTLSFTCASCHFAKLPDGRYAVGAPNHEYHYGKQNLALAVFPLVAMLGGADQHDPDAIAAIQPLLDKANADPLIKANLTAALTSLIAGGAGMVPPFPKEAEHHYANWKPGTMDFLIEPLPVNDGVHTISKISALWGIPDQNEQDAAGMPHAMLGWTGGTHSLTNFATAFVTFGGGDGALWPNERVEPLVQYVLSLRAPENPQMPEASLVSKGEDLFYEKGCASCHGGPRGSGTKVYTFEEIGTDDAMKRWLDPMGTGEACCNAPVPPEEKKVTHGIKSPRLVGLWAMRRYLHNGSVDTLEDLFCSSGPRGSITEEAYGDAGHDMTCDGLDDGDKQALIAFLRAH